jgi:hypothetical protein
MEVTRVAFFDPLATSTGRRALSGSNVRTGSKAFDGLSLAMARP